MASLIRLFTALALASLAIAFVKAEERICGQTLRATMEFLCKGRFQTMYDAKRSSGATLGNTAAGVVPETFDWLFNPAAHQQHPRFQRSPKDYDWYVAGGISDQCCDNPCSINTMLSYCKS